MVTSWRCFLFLFAARQGDDSTEKKTVSSTASTLYDFLPGSVKSISEIRANGTLLKVEGNQEQGGDVHDMDFLACTLASSVKSIAAIL